MEFSILRSTLYVTSLPSLDESTDIADIVLTAQRHGVTHVVLSLGRIHALDATGIGALVRLYSRLMARSVEFTVCDLQRPVAKLMKAVGVDIIFVGKPLQIAPSVAAMPARV